MTGQGNITVNQKRQTGAPFPAGAADNGLSVDAITGRIVLGDDPGGILSTLINNREIPLNSFSITLSDANDTTVLNAAQIDLNGSSGTNLITAFADATQAFLFMRGDVSLSDAPRITIDPNNGAAASIQNHSDTFIITQGQNASDPPFLYINLTGGPYTFGDRAGAFSGSQLDIDTGNGIATLDIGIVTASRSLELNPGISGTRPQSYSIGDLAAVANGTFLQVDDGTGTVFIANSAMNAGVNINGLNGFTGTVNPITSITVVGGIVTNAA